MQACGPALPTRRVPAAGGRAACRNLRRGRARERSRRANLRRQGLDRGARARASPGERADLEAFSDGINAAMRTRPLPPEFRALGYKPEPWTSADSLTASFLDGARADRQLGRRAGALRRVRRARSRRASDAFFPITDPKYDSPTTSRERAPVAPLPPLSVAYPAPSPLAFDDARDRAGLGSNDFVAGADLTATHRALLANDPHLGLHMPGVWYLADLAAPGIHVAGATLVGAPGIILGHTAHVAWGATNGTVATVAIYRETFRSADLRRISRRHVAGKERRTAARRSRCAGVSRSCTTICAPGTVSSSQRAACNASPLHGAPIWTAVPPSPPSANSTAPRTSPTYCTRSHAIPGPPQNFVFADDSGKAGYLLAGGIPIDPLWALRAHDGPSSGVTAYERRSLRDVAARRSIAARRSPSPPTIAFTAAATRTVLPPTSKRRTAPLASHNIWRRTPTRRPRSPRIQADVSSIPERDLAAATVAALARTGTGEDPDMKTAAAQLATFDGRFTPDSTGALYAWQLRRSARTRA